MGTQNLGVVELRPSGVLSALNLSTNTLVRAGAGVVCKICVNSATASAFTLYDAATTGTEAAANAILSVSATQGVQGAVFNIDFPVTNGIAINVTAGSVSLSYI